MTMPRDEAEALALAAAGRWEGLEWIVARYQDRLAAYAAVRLGDPDGARDIVQNVFLRAHELIRKGWKPDHLRAWLYSVTHNLVVNELQRRSAGQRAVERLIERHADEPAHPAERDDLVRHVRREMARLPEPMEAIVTLKFQQELTYEEVAEVLSIPVGTAKVYAARALKMMRERMSHLLD